MREILFRGKRKDNGELVYGFYCYNPLMKRGEMFSFDAVRCYVYEVIPETVGQFTGLTDRNGKKIFEGDIVRFQYANYVVQREDETPGGCWASTAYILDEIGVDCFLSFEETIDNYCNEICVEIIGNIHDNPELLSGKEGDI